jgi:hypothetical protein
MPSFPTGWYGSWQACCQAMAGSMPQWE